jgi:hypothetical protein
MSSEMNRFAEAAIRYCRLIENYGGEDWQSFATKLQRSLAELIFEAHLLADVGGDAEAVQDSVSQDEWKVLYSKLKSVLPVQEYWMVYAPVDHADHEPVVADLADDLADIWRDLQPALRAMGRLGSAVEPERLNWEWRFSFQSHWGAHATSALALLHRTVVND